MSGLVVSIQWIKFRIRILTNFIEETFLHRGGGGGVKGILLLWAFPDLNVITQL